MFYKIPKRYLFILALITVYNLLTLFIRNIAEGNSNLNFLIWNLFLAFLPLLFAWLIYQFAARMNKVLIILCTFVWLLFYPNAPYMISDLIHIQQLNPMVLYDALIIFSFAILALFFGFYSLKIIHVLYKQIAGKKVAHTVVWVSIILSSAGIYLGRILRLNSWDFFTHPLQVIITIFEHLFPIGTNVTTYIIIVLFSVIQFILLIMTKDMDMIDRNSLISGDYKK
jgi:uncharacterized membrane protein